MSDRLEKDDEMIYPGPILIEDLLETEINKFA